MPKRTKPNKSSPGPTSSTAFVPPPSTAEQKRLRQKDHSIVPPPPYLLASKFLDVACDHVPVLKNACPDSDVGGWRSKLPNPEWGTFPDGKLSHSFDSYFQDGEVARDVSFGDYMRQQQQQQRGDGSSVSATFGDYYDFAFHTTNTTLGDLTYPSSLAVLLALVLSIRAFKRLFLPRFSDLGRSMGRSAHGPGWEDENADRIVKFGEYVYRLLYHSSVSAYGLWYFRDKSWWFNTENLWVNHGFQPIEPGMAWYFLLQSAYNLDALWSLLVLSFSFEWVNPLAYSGALDFPERDHVVDDSQRKREVFQLMARSRRRTLLWTPLFEIKWSKTVRGDFREMAVHHVVTNALVLGASYYRFARVGSAILLAHDLSDVPVDLSKLANFVKWKVATISCFVVMCCAWIATRLYVLPFVIIRSIVMESYEHMVVRGAVDPAIYDAYSRLFHALLAALVFLHVTWFLILLRIGWTLVSKGETHDLTEHKDGEDSKKDR